MDKVLENYFEGIRGNNTDKDNIRTDMNPFVEVYEQDGQAGLGAQRSLHGRSRHCADSA